MGGFEFIGVEPILNVTAHVLRSQLSFDIFQIVLLCDDHRHVCKLILEVFRAAACCSIKTTVDRNAYFGYNALVIEIVRRFLQHVRFLRPVAFRDIETIEFLFH